MTRELKFRIWDDKKKQWLNDGAYDVLAIDASGSVFRCYTESCESPFKELYYQPIVSQFIGIKDKTGKEIYEGDIVSCWDNSAKDPNWELDKVHTGIIEYTGNNYALKLEYVFLGYWYNAENIEIIGNIFETPELVNNKP